MDLRGIEPRSARCERAILPLNERPLVAGVGVEPTCEAYETSDCTDSLTRSDKPTTINSLKSSALVGQALSPANLPCRIQSILPPATRQLADESVCHTRFAALSEPTENGAGHGTRNRTLLITSEVLCLLSYPS